MKHLKLFEEKRYKKNIYYDRSLTEILDKDWTEISTLRDTITFEVGDSDDSKDGYEYSVFFERGYNDEYYLEKSAIPKFVEKFKKEFNKNPELYVKNFKYDPKCLGDIDMYRDVEKYNL